jgi:hypothetical protein
MSDIIKDSIYRDSMYVIVIWGIGVYAIQHIAKYIHVRKNWDRMRCRPEIMQSAWMFGKNKDDNMEYCLENAGKQIIDNNFVAPITKNIGDIRNELNNRASILDTKYNTINDKINSAEFYKTKQNTNLAISIQNNILAVKEGLQKVIASLVIQKHMNNGVLKMTSTNKMFNDSLRESINKIN